MANTNVPTTSIATKTVNASRIPPILPAHLGQWGTKASRREYDRLTAEWLANHRHLPVTQNDGLTVMELAAAFAKRLQSVREVEAKLAAIRQEMAKEPSMPADPITIKEMPRLASIDDNTIYNWGTNGRPKPILKNAAGFQRSLATRSCVSGVIPTSFAARTRRSYVR